MAAGEAITARMAIDLNGLRKDLSESEKMVGQSARQTQKRMESAAAATIKGKSKGSAFGSTPLKKPHGEGGGGESGHGNSQNNRAIGDTLDAVTGQKGWVMRMNMLAHSLPLAAFAGGVIAVEKMSEALEKMNEADKVAREELAKPLNISVAQGAESVKEAIQGIDKAVKGLEGSRSFLGTMGDMLMQQVRPGFQKLTGHKVTQSGNEESLHLQEQLEERRFQLSAALASKVNEETQARAEATRSGKTDLEIYEAKLRTAEKIAKINADETLLPDSKLALKRQAQQEGDDSVDSLNRKKGAAWNDRKTGDELNYVHGRGRDVAVGEAQAHLGAAQYEERHAVGDEETKAAQTKVRAAELALEQAKKETAEKREQLAIETEVANFRGSADERHAMALDKENAQLKKLLSTAKEDDKAGLSAKLAQNELARLEAARAAASNAAGASEAWIGAGTGRGQGEEMRALRERLALAESESQRISADPLSSDRDKAGAAGKSNDIRKQLADMEESSARLVAESNNQNEVLDQQIQHHAAIAEALRTQFEYQEKIVQARKDGNSELASSLEKQQRLALQSQIAGLQREQGDRSKATLGELAGNAFNENGRQARQASRLERRANQERVRGHGSEADRLQSQADDIKKHIVPLKDSEKQGALLKDQLKELKEISKNTKKGFAVR